MYGQNNQLVARVENYWTGWAVSTFAQNRLQTLIRLSDSSLIKLNIFCLIMFDSGLRTFTLVSLFSGQFGTPGFSVAAFFACFIATILSILDSIGDYIACARVSRVPPPPSHAVNRGILIEGTCSFLSGAIGCGHATSTTGGNIGAIGITKVLLYPNIWRRSRGILLLRCPSVRPSVTVCMLCYLETVSGRSRYFVDGWIINIK